MFSNSLSGHSHLQSRRPFNQQSIGKDWRKLETDSHIATGTLHQVSYTNSKQKRAIDAIAYRETPLGGKTMSITPNSSVKMELIERVTRANFNAGTRYNPVKFVIREESPPSQSRSEEQTDLAAINKTRLNAFFECIQTFEALPHCLLHDISETIGTKIEPKIERVAVPSLQHLSAKIIAADNGTFCTSIDSKLPPMLKELLVGLTTKEIAADHKKFVSVMKSDIDPDTKIHLAIKRSESVGGWG
jgi:hypothetical protein